MSLMLLKEFFKKFPDEKSCVSFFKKVRLDNGIICPKCGCTELSWLDGRQSFQCVKCGYRTPLTKGTVMEKSHLPLYSWFFTMHLMTSIKQVLSAKEIQYQLEMKAYSPVWLMMMKLRDIMGKRDSTYQLSGKIELDVSYFPTYEMQSRLSGEVEHMRNSQKTTVLVMAESEAVDDVLAEYLSNISDNESINKASRLLKKSEKQNIKKVVNYIKMYAMPNQRFETIKPLVEKSIDSNSTLVTDGGKSLIGLKNLVDKLEQHLETEGEVHEVVTKTLPWVHIITGECRSGIEAIHKEIDNRFLQLYLNEYCWKFNRRYFRDSKDPNYDLFYRLVKIASMYTSDIKWRDYNV